MEHKLKDYPLFTFKLTHVNVLRFRNRLNYIWRTGNAIFIVLSIPFWTVLGEMIHGVTFITHEARYWLNTFRGVMFVAIKKA